MTKIVYPCGCAEDTERYGLAVRLDCPLHGLTPPEDEPTGDLQEPDGDFTICPDCGEDLAWHQCPEGARAQAEREKRWLTEQNQS